MINSKSIKFLIGKLRRNKDFLEKTPMVIAYHAWQTKPYAERVVVNAEWDRYYNLVRQSKTYARFFEQKEAMHNGNMALVREIAEESKDHVFRSNYIPKPKSIDPFEYSNNSYIRSYKETCQRLKELEIDEEYGVKEIFA